MIKYLNAKQVIGSDLKYVFNLTINMILLYILNRIFFSPNY